MAQLENLYDENILYESSNINMDILKIDIENLIQSRRKSGRCIYTGNYIYNNNTQTYDLERRYITPFLDPSPNLIIGSELFKDSIYTLESITKEYFRYSNFEKKSKSDKFLLTMLTSCFEDNKMLAKDIINNLNKNRKELRSIILKKIYKSFLDVLLDVIFIKDKSLNNISNYNIDIYNFSDPVFLIINFYKHLLSDDNYKINNLKNDSTYEDVLNFFIPYKNKISSFSNDIYQRYIILTDTFYIYKAIYFIDLSDRLSNKLIFRIVNTSSTNYNNRLDEDRILKNYRNFEFYSKDKSYRLNKDELEELKYFSDIDLYKVLEIDNNFYNFI